MDLYFLSWNVNGIRAVQKNGFTDFLKKENPEVLCIQEIKIDEDKYKEIKKINGYESLFFSAKKKGYSGTSIYYKKDLDIKKITKGINCQIADGEGRTITIEFKDFFLINAYFPNSKPELKRLDYKLEFFLKIQKYIEKLMEKKPVIICGDLNVAHKEIDLKNPKANEKNPGFTIQERNALSDFLKIGFLDAFRIFTKQGGYYSWWSYRFNARKRNIGWRLDYFLIDKRLKKNIIESKILDQVYGSDHAPVTLKLKF